MEDKNKNAHPFDLETVLKQEIIELFFFNKNIWALFQTKFVTCKLLLVEQISKGKVPS